MKDKQSLYCKYMGPETARIVLSNGTLRWSTPSFLNDPYDIRFEMQAEYSRGRVVVSALYKLWESYLGGYDLKDSTLAPVIEIMKTMKMDFETFRAHVVGALEESMIAFPDLLARFNEELLEVASRVKILCLTDRSDSQLMWAYYADSNRGVVLQFQDLPELDSPFCEAKRIQYSDKMPLICDEDGLSDVLAGRRNFRDFGGVDALIYTKSRVWEHEREWRICSGFGRNFQEGFEDVRFHPHELKSVIFGCKASDDLKRDVGRILGDLYPQALMQQCEMERGSFKLKISEL